jgi:hypothetical protein
MSAVSPAASPYHRPAMSRPAAAATGAPRRVQGSNVLRVAGILLLGLAIGVAATFAYYYLFPASQGEPAPSLPAAKVVKQASSLRGRWSRTPARYSSAVRWWAIKSAR